MPEWPSRRPQWLENLKGVYESDPTQFYRHIDTWFEQVETSVSIARADDYSRWIRLNCNESRCFTGIIHAFPDASLTECLQASDIVRASLGLSLMMKILSWPTGGILPTRRWTVECQVSRSMFLVYAYREGILFTACIELKGLSRPGSSHRSYPDEICPQYYLFSARWPTFVYVITSLPIIQGCIFAVRHINTSTSVKVEESTLRRISIILVTV